MTIIEPPTDAAADWDVPVAMRDGARLRANVFRPAAQGRYPVLLCAHPYEKDRLPRRKSTGGYRVPLQYRLMRTAALTHSAWTSWEAPDPAYWISQGYVVVNADLRGWGTSEGRPGLLCAQDGLDVHDLVEWSASQPWSSGKVGMSGVSYLAITQWLGAATRPPHLAAICPWEGFTDLYRDFARPGGIQEAGFLSVWGAAIQRASGGRVDLAGQVARRPLFDSWYADRLPDIEAIETPALVCGSFSDHNLHSRGSFEGFSRLGSTHKWLYTHRGPKWATYYSEEALRAQTQFFDHFLKARPRQRDHGTGITAEPAVRLEIRDDRSTVTEVRRLASWPPTELTWTTLRCRAAPVQRRTHRGNPMRSVPDQNGHVLVDEPADAAHRLKTTGEADRNLPPCRISGTSNQVPGRSTISFDSCSGRASFRYRFARDTVLAGPMLLTLTLSVTGFDDVPVIASVRKFRSGREITFEGSYGFRGDWVTHGMLLASHRATEVHDDAAAAGSGTGGADEPTAGRRSRPAAPRPAPAPAPRAAVARAVPPRHPHTKRQPLIPGMPVSLDIELLPSATQFRTGDELRLDVQGHWPRARDPILGQFPVRYRTDPAGVCTLHLDVGRGCSLMVPVLHQSRPTR